MPSLLPCTKPYIIIYLFIRLYLWYKCFKAKFKPIPNFTLHSLSLVPCTILAWCGGIRGEPLRSTEMVANVFLYMRDNKGSLALLITPPFYTYMYEKVLESRLYTCTCTFPLWSGYSAPVANPSFWLSLFSCSCQKLHLLFTTFVFLCSRSSLWSFQVLPTETLAVRSSPTGSHRIRILRFACMYSVQLSLTCMCTGHFLSRMHIALV